MRGRVGISGQRPEVLAAPPPCVDGDPLAIQAAANASRQVSRLACLSGSTVNTFDQRNVPIGCCECPSARWGLTLRYNRPQFAEAIGEDAESRRERVDIIGTCTWPPSARAANSCSASALLEAVSESENPLKSVSPDLWPSEASTVVSPMRSRRWLPCPQLRAGPSASLGIQNCAHPALTALPFRLARPMSAYR